MPKNTFYNLPQAKQKKIEHGSLNVFLNNPYNKVTISLIVKSVGIPRGSFYQYFEDLEDLYQYLFEQTIKDYEMYIYERLESLPHLNVFDFFKESFHSDYQFLKTTDYYELMRKFFKERQMIGINIDHFQKRKSKFHEESLKRLNKEYIEKFSHEKQLKVLRLIAHVKFQLIHKIISEKATYTEAYEDFSFYCDLLRNGAKEI